MGFTASASWAQLFNESMIKRAQLPLDRRLVDGQVPPTSLPCWGSILDDFWAVEVEDGDPLAVAGQWMEEITTQWAKAGIVEHLGKRVQDARRTEVQGAMIDGDELWCGLSREKRARLVEAGLYLLRCSRPQIKPVARWTGKMSYAQFFRSCTRCTVSELFGWVDAHRRGQRGRGRWTRGSRREVLESCLLLPFTQLDLASPYCTRLESSDASPGGHGRAYTYVEPSVVAEICQLTAGKGVYTSLSLEHGLALEEDGRCPLHQVDFPEVQYAWKEIPRPGGYRHITLEEASALTWSVESRLHRPAELRTRCIHLIDSAALTGAVRKGRSSLRLLNGQLRQLAACAIAGAFCPWVPSARNPSDAASSVFGIRAQGEDPTPAGIHPIRVPRAALPAAAKLVGEHPWVQQLLDDGAAKMHLATGH